jgi:hypothetical protein
VDGFVPGQHHVPASDAPLPGSDIARTASESIGKLVAAATGLQHLEVHLVRIDPDVWLGALPRQLSALEKSIGILRLDVPRLSTAGAAAISAILADPACHINYLEVNTSKEQMTPDAVLVIFYKVHAVESSY